MAINSNSKSNSVFSIVNEYIGSEKFYASIGEYVFCYCVVLFIVCICMLIGAKAIDWFKDMKAKKEAKEKAKRRAEIAGDLSQLRKIYNEEFNSKIEGKVYKNLKEVEETFQNKIWNEFKQEAYSRKLTESDFNNFTCRVIEAKWKLERDYKF